MQRAANHMGHSLFRFAYFCTFLAVVSGEHAACCAFPTVPPPEPSPSRSSLPGVMGTLHMDIHRQQQSTGRSCCESHSIRAARHSGQRMLLALPLYEARSLHSGRALVSTGTQLPTNISLTKILSSSRTSYTYFIQARLSFISLDLIMVQNQELELY